MRWITMHLYSLTVCFLVGASVIAASDEKDLFKKIFKDYEPKIRPIKDASRAVNVTIGLNLIQLKEINEKSETHSIVGIFDVEWNDEFLTWEPEHHGNISEIVVPPTQVWLPDFGILNSVEEFYQDTFFKHFRVHVGSEGRIVWPIGGVFTTACDIDTTIYPMDTQTCTIVIENWSYTKKAVELSAESAKIHSEKFHEDGIWDLVGSSIDYEDVSYAMHPGIIYPKLKFSFQWQRKPRYYIVNVMLPCFFLLCIALLVFWLPPDAGEKVSLGITVLLAFSVFQLIIADNTPENSDSTPILSVFVTLAMAMSTSSVITTVLVLYLHFKPVSTPAPNWLKFICFNVIAKAICISKRLKHRKVSKKGRPDPESAENKSLAHEVSAVNPPKQKTSSQSSLNNLDKAERAEGNNELTEVTLRLQEILKHMEKVSQKLNNEDTVNNESSEWQDIAIVFDRLCFWIASFIFLVACIAMMCQL